MSQHSLALKDPTPLDGNATINIGSLAQTALGRMLNYYDPTPKVTTEGLDFHMYAGLYFFIITEGDNHRFLSAKTVKELEAKRKYRWENVPGIETHLEACLCYNLRQSTLALSLLVRHPLPIVWEEPDRALRNAEKRWLRVVQRTVDRLRNEYKT